MQGPEAGFVVAIFPAQMWLERTRLACMFGWLQVDVRIVGAFMTRRSGCIAALTAFDAVPKLQNQPKEKNSQK